jgi:hypothetical protein
MRDLTLKLTGVLEAVEAKLSFLLFGKMLFVDSREDNA